ncbi:hypothetical protein [Streptomyces sp. NPDC088254]|uniref:hypothetical protein n=1 Tax=Streptomyces sp. NPDC088254 TaxID=3365847 RepID=UPI00381076A5
MVFFLPSFWKAGLGQLARPDGGVAGAADGAHGPEAVDHADQAGDDAHDSGGDARPVRLADDCHDRGGDGHEHDEEQEATLTSGLVAEVVDREAHG